MGTERTVSRWLFAAFVVVPIIEWVFSFEGLASASFLAQKIGIPLAFGSGSLMRASLVALAVGILVVAGLSWTAVARWRAPSDIWLAALAVSILQLTWLGVRILDTLLIGAAWGQSMDLFAGSTAVAPFLSWPVYVSAALFYPLAAWLGCRRAAVALASGRSTIPADVSQEQRTHA